MTEYGNVASNLPVEPLWAHALIVASENQCLSEMIVLAAIASAKTPIYVLRPFTEAARLARQMFATPLSDHISQLNAFTAYIQFCGEVAKDDNFSVQKVCGLTLVVSISNMSSGAMTISFAIEHWQRSGALTTDLSRS
jgi:HrpA-like RNA helicase